MIVFGEYESSRNPTFYGRKITIGVFFDGTGNNRENTRSRKIVKGKEVPELAGESAEKRAERVRAFLLYGKADSSYFNDESNVSRLEPNYLQDEPNTFRVYVEGIGTTDFDSDSSLGQGLGMFSTGVVDRVKLACEKIKDKINKKVDKEELINITFDVYGFSRGAAAARHFIYEVMKPADIQYIPQRSYGRVIKKEIPAHGHIGRMMGSLGVTLEGVQIRFAGLYDTVASYGFNHKDDTQELHLDQLYHAKKVVHLTAQDEIRINFRLTNVVSAPTGTTISLPGAHSDIGGGYGELIEEEDTLLYQKTNLKLNSNFYAEITRKHFIDQGWYQPHEIEFDNAYFLGFDEVIGKRKNLTNKYSVIPLQLMANYSNENKASINLVDLKDDHKLEEELLVDAYSRIKEEIACEKGSKHLKVLAFDEQKNREELSNKELKAFKEEQEKNRKLTQEQFRKQREEAFHKPQREVEQDDIEHPNILVRTIDKNTERWWKENPIENEIEEVVVNQYSKNHFIKKLRNKYLHISSHYKNSAVIVVDPMAPEEDRDRGINKG